MSAPTFSLGSFLAGLMNVPQSSLVTVENAATGALAALCQAGAGQVGAVMSHRLMMTGPWDKVQPWLLKSLQVGPGTRLLVHFRFDGKEMPVLTALDKLRRQHGLKPLLPNNTWVFPPMTSPDGAPLGKLNTVCTVIQV